MTDLAERDSLIEANVQLMYWMARRAAKKFTQLDLDELISLGGIAMVKAAGAFDTERGMKFATFYTTCFQNEILMALRALRKQPPTMSLDAPIAISGDGDSIYLADIIAGSDDTEGDAITKHELGEAREMISSLKPSERDCVLGMIEGRTQRDIAAEHGFTQSYASRTLRKAQKKLLSFRDGKTPMKTGHKAERKELTRMEQKELSAIKIQASGMATIPVKLIKALGLSAGDAVDVWLDGKRIMLEKSMPRCLICGGRAGMIGGKQVCRACAESIAKAMQS